MLRLIGTSVIGLCVAGACFAQFNYSDFDDDSTLALLGDATQIITGRIRLVHEDQSLAGAMWHNDPQFVVGGFETIFHYRTSGFGADGFAFVLHNSVDGLSAIGGSGERLGYGPGILDGNFVPGIDRSIAVEFDIWTNGVPQFSVGDPNDNHISVHTAGAGENDADEVFSIGSVSDNLPDIDDGRSHTVKVFYDGFGNFRVYLDDMQKPKLSVEVDMSTLELTDGMAYVGMTAGTGGFYTNMDIIDWSFTPLLIGDVNQDGCVDDADLTELILNYGMCLP